MDVQCCDLWPAYAGVFSIPIGLHYQSKLNTSTVKIKVAEKSMSQGTFVTQVIQEKICENK